MTEHLDWMMGSGPAMAEAEARARVARKQALLDDGFEVVDPIEVFESDIEMMNAGYKRLEGFWVRRPTAPVTALPTPPPDLTDAEREAALERIERHTAARRRPRLGLFRRRAKGA